MRVERWLSAMVVALGAASSAWATGVLTQNLVGGGNFEDRGTTTFTGASGTVTDYRYFKREHSPLLQEEIDAGAAPVRAWQFHPAFDFGRWLPVWGVSNVPYEAQKGIGVYDYPRSYWSEANQSWTEPVNPINVSADPLNGLNHVLEGVIFRSWAGQFIQIPNQIAGPAKFDLDYYLKYWVPAGISDAPVLMHAYVYGVPEEALPTWQERWGPGTPETPGIGPAGAVRLYATPHFGNWGGDSFYTDDGFVQICDPAQFTQGQWHTLSEGVTAAIPNSGGQTRTTDGSFVIDAIYPYYYVAVWLCVWSEQHEYYWNGWKPPEVFSVGVDNVTLRVTVPLGDVNRDRIVNALDIAPFVDRLVHAVYQVEADTNQDGLINALDIAGFVGCITGAACGSGAGSVVPEPGTAAMAAATALAGRSLKDTVAPGGQVDDAGEGGSVDEVDAVAGAEIDLLGVAFEVEQENELAPAIGTELGGDTFRGRGVEDARELEVAHEVAEEVGVEAHVVARGDVEGAALAETVNGEGGAAGVHVAVEGGEDLGGFGVQKVDEGAGFVGAGEADLGAGGTGYDLGVFVLVKGVDFLGPDASELAERAGEPAQVTQVVFVDDAGPVGGDEDAPASHEFLEAFSHAGADHVQHGGDDELVAGEVAILADDVDGDAAHPEGAVVVNDGGVVVLALGAGAFGVFQGPAVFPVVDDGNLGADGGADEGVELL